jgi:hypothetical protein
MIKIGKKEIGSYIMASIGLILILLWVINYLFSLKIGFPPVIFGVIFLALGIANIKKGKTTPKE